MNKSVFTFAQQQIIDFATTPSCLQKAVVEAGAGAGKTKTLVGRIERLMQEGLRPSEVLVASFSRTAAQELQERLWNLVHHKDPGSTCAVHTIDGFFWNLFCAKYQSWRNHALKVLSSEWHYPRWDNVTEPYIVPENFAKKTLHKTLIEHLQGFYRRENVVDFLLGKSFQENNLKAILKAMLSDDLILAVSKPLVPGSKWEHPALRDLLNLIKGVSQNLHIQRLMDGSVTYTDVTLFLYHTIVLRGQIPLNAMYASMLNAQDFKNLFFDSESCVSFKEMIIDEYQDTNEIQHNILLSICGNERMVVVGDPKQSIYGFRNAHVGVFQSLKCHPHWSTFELSTNFRSHPDLLKAMNRLSELGFSYLKASFPEDFLNHDFAKNVVLYRSQSVGLEPGRAAESVASDGHLGGLESARVRVIGHSLKRERGLTSDVNARDFQRAVLLKELKDFALNRYKPNEIAILCERNDTCAEVVQLCADHGISAIHMSSHYENSGFLLNERMFLCSLIRLISSRGELYRCDVFYVFASPLCGWDLCTASHLVQLFFDEKVSSSISDGCVSFVSEFREDLAKARKMFSLNPVAGVQFLKRHLLKTAIRVNVRSESVLSFLLNLDHLLEGITKIGSIPENFFDLSFSDLTSTLNSKSTPQQNGPLITVTTIHGAKGREWPLVIFIPNRTEVMRDTNSFKMAVHPLKNFVLWESDDRGNPTALCAQIPIENLDFDAEIDFIPHRNKMISVADMQKHLLGNFEASRAFYTALTRAREELWIPVWFSQSRHKSSLRDTLGTVKETDDLIEACEPGCLADYVLLSYLDENFDLRKPKKRGAVPKEPWFSPVAYAEPKESNKGDCCYIEYGPNSVNEVMSHFIAPSPHKNHESFHSLPSWGSRVLNERISRLHNASQPDYWDDLLRTASIGLPERVGGDMGKEKPKGSERKTDRNSSEDMEFSFTDPAQEGILFHAQLEQALGSDRGPMGDIPHFEVPESPSRGLRDTVFQPFSQSELLRPEHPLRLLRKACLEYRTECEFWMQKPQIDVPVLPQQGASSRPESFLLPVPQRRIMDVWATVLSHQVPHCFFTPRLLRYIEGLGVPPSQAPGLELNLVIDFKSGVPSSAHGDQICDYMGILQRALGPQAKVCGILYYRNRNASFNMEDWVSQDPHGRIWLKDFQVALETWDNCR